MAEAGFIADKRCDEVLDILESKRLPDDGHSVPEEECQALVEWMQKH